MYGITPSEILMVIVYWVLVFFWFAVTVTAVVLWKAREPKFPSRHYRLIGIAFSATAFVLFLDSAYWAIANSAHVDVVSGELERYFRDAWLVSGVKLLVLASSLTFLVILLRSSRSHSRELEQMYFHTFVNQSWDAIGILDEDGKVKLWNKGAEELFGWKEQDVRGLHINKFLVPEERHQEVLTTLNWVRENQLPKLRYLTERKKNSGDLIRVEISISPIKEPGFSGFFGIMRDASSPARDPAARLPELPAETEVQKTIHPRPGPKTQGVKAE